LLGAPPPRGGVEGGVGGGRGGGGGGDPGTLTRYQLGTGKNNNKKRFH